MNNSLRFIFVSLALTSAIPHIALANPNDMIFASDFEHFQVRAATSTSRSTTLGPLQKAEYIVDRGAKALRYIGRDAVVDSLNNLSSATNNLVKDGARVNHIHTIQKSLIPQIGFAAMGFLASACGLGVITYTALQKDQKDTTRKYIAGTGMLTMGIASLVASYLFSMRG